MTIPPSDVATTVLGIPGKAEPIGVPGAGAGLGMLREGGVCVESELGEDESMLLSGVSWPKITVEGKSKMVINKSNVIFFIYSLVSFFFNSLISFCWSVISLSCSLISS
jgi:hypothetical protein